MAIETARRAPRPPRVGVTATWLGWLGWLGWAAIVVGLYYTKLWEFVAGGPAAWQAFAVFDGQFDGVVAARGAAVRTVAGMGGAAVTLVAALGLGSLVCRRLGWRSDTWQTWVPVHASIGFAAVSFAALAASALGLYSRWPLRVAVITTALVTLARARPTAARFVRRVRRDLRWPRGALDRSLAALTGIALAIALVGALAPEREWDALWYHLGFLPGWLDHGGLVDVPFEYPSLSPMGWELVFGTGIAMGGSIAAKLLHFSCLPLTALLVHATVRRHVPGASPWVATALFVTTPIVLWEATTAYVDLALALHVSVGLLGAWHYARTGSLPWLGVAALSLGMGAATKHLALPFVGFVVVALAWHLHQKTGSWMRAAAVPVGLGLVGLVMAAPWYFRAWEASGNPFFPEMYDVLGADSARWNDTAEAGLDQFKDRFGRDRNLVNLVALPWDVTLHAARYGGTLGSLYLALLPALAIPGARTRVRWLGALALAIVVVWASPLGSYQMRFLVPVVPVLAVLTAVAGGRAARASPHGLRRALGFALVAVLALNLPPFTPYHERDRQGWEGWLTHVVHQIPLPVVVGAETKDDYLGRWVPSSRAWSYADDHLDPGALVLTFTGGDHLLSGDVARIPADSVAAWSAAWGSSANQEARAVAALRDLGVTHVLFDLETMATTDPAELAVHPGGSLAPSFEVEYRDGRILLVALPWTDRADRRTGG